jgi:hypothetical protein
MSDIAAAVGLLAAFPGIVAIVTLLVNDHRLRKKNANQKICLEMDGARIRQLVYDVRALQDTVRCLIAEVDYHLHGGVADTICDAAREWRDGSITRAYMMPTEKGGTSLSGICRYCKRPLRPGELTCDNCGAMTVSAEAVRLWSGK